ncbi:conjugative transposon protein TraN [Chitinophaga tropicalis]|nr:conjugative transposon protein TraN [Chitinophaga tropicalis]
MKRIFLLVAITIVCSITLNCYGQTNPVKSLASLSLGVSAERTTVLIFPANISRVDIGTPDIVAKTVKVGNTEKVLRLKATRPDVASSSMHVFTDDGKVYPFDLAYTRQLETDTWDFTTMATSPVTETGQISGKMLPAQVRQTATGMCGHVRTMIGLKTKSMGIKLTVEGIYYQDGVLFFHLLVHNRSQIPYQLDFGRYYIRDQRTSKRTTLMEKEIQPQYEHRCKEAALPGGGSMAIVAAFDQFTIADRKQFMIELYEKGGDRHLRCRIKGRHLLRAEPLAAAGRSIPPEMAGTPGNGAQ